jgi:hypothetical protein
MTVSLVHEIHWGDAPTWAGAIVALAALVAAVLAFRQQARQLKALEKQAADQHEFNVHQSSALDAQAEQQAAQLQILQEQVTDQLDFNRRQAKVLDLQAEELRAVRAEREREATERRRRQASQIFLECDNFSEPSAAFGRGGEFIIPEHYSAKVTNSSEQPIYDVRVRWFKGTAEWYLQGSAEDSLPRLMPKDSEAFARDYSEGGNLAMLGAIMEFRDSAGQRWRLDKQGNMSPLESSDQQALT